MNDQIISQYPNFTISNPGANFGEKTEDLRLHFSIPIWLMTAGVSPLVYLSPKVCQMRYLCGAKIIKFMNRTLLFVLLSLSQLSLFAQDKPKWDVSNPSLGGVPYSDVEFTTSEGTWMCLDVSPDGKTIVFDMLGDIYTMPISGGTTTCIRSGLAWEVQPRFSPDGKKSPSLRTLVAAITSGI
jgi:hypothetical protein